MPRLDARLRYGGSLLILPIPFDGWGKMEVDLLCPSARLVIELDGRQHLANADAYRRDRRKDALLPEHGYFVLRVLTEDVARRLDAVLDAILRALSHRWQATVINGNQILFTKVTDASSRPAARAEFADGGTTRRGLTDVRSPFS